MTYQIIVSTMHQNDDSLIEKMHINSDAIIINQADRVGYHETQLEKGTVKWFHFNERGIGLSRNSGLMRATADIVQFADDDMELYEGYNEKVLEEYRKHPEADMILFSNNCLNKDMMPYPVHKFGRVRRMEAVNFGGARITARREKLLYNNLTFSLLFGGGARYSAGEDTTFIQDCVKAGLKVYKSPVVLSDMKQETSTWYTGLTKKYFVDKGVLLAANFPLISRFGIIIQALKNSRHCEFSFKEVLGFYRQGVREFFENK